MPFRRGPLAEEEIKTVARKALRKADGAFGTLE